MTSSHQMYSPFISSNINPENLEVPSAKEVFITKAQDGFSLKSRRNPDKEHDDFQQPITPVKKHRANMFTQSIISRKRLFQTGVENED